MFACGFAPTNSAPEISRIGNRSLTNFASHRWSASGRNITDGFTAMLNRDFKEFIASLNDKGVRYLVVGGYAVALHGHPRYTKDLDVWIEMNESNAARLLEALRQFGFDSLGLEVQDFLVADQIMQLGYPPCRIDLLVTLQGVEFGDCYASRTNVMIDEVSVDFIDLENLKRNKRATGRLQDLADVENLST